MAHRGFTLGALHFFAQYLFASVWVRRTLYIHAACSGLCPVAHVDSKASTTPSPHEDAVGWCVRLRLPIGRELLLYTAVQQQQARDCQPFVPLSAGNASHSKQEKEPTSHHGSPFSLHQ